LCQNRFGQLQQQIDKLDYQSFSQVGRALQRLEAYIKESKKRKDWAGIRASQDSLEDWLVAINKKTTGQPALSLVQAGNLLRAEAILKWFRTLL